jgi:uroporphyrin-3 C-methyltransferase
VTDDHAAAVKPRAEGASAPRAAGRLLAAIALILAAAAVALSAYEFAQRGELDARGAVAGLENRVTSLGRENERLEAALAEMRGRADTLAGELSTLRSGLEALEAGSRRGNVDFALAEIEYLLIIATQRLVLSRDPRTALAALEAADRRLAGFEEPALTALRAQFASDMNALRAVPDVDIAGLSLFLADLAQRVELLPLRDEYLQRREEAATQPAVPETARGWRGFWQGIWNEISRHMIVTRTDRGARVTLLPEEKFFLAHNLRLQLETARLAVLRGDTGSLHASLAIAGDWLRTYYDSGSAAVANVLESMTRMSSIRLDPELPDISSSLESVRALTRGRAAGPGVHTQ